MIELVGITGKARHGKDTVCAMIREVCPGFQRFAFADKMKEMAKTCFKAEHDDVGEWKEKEQLFTIDYEAMHKWLNSESFGARWKLCQPFYEMEQAIHRMTPDYQEHPAGENYATFTGSWRLVYQLIGTDWGRKQDEDLWVDFLPLDKPTIVSDVRGHGDCATYEGQNNEALTIKKAGGIVVRVVDPRKGDVVRGHASEAGIDPALIDYTIMNDGTIEDLRRAVKDFVYIWLMSDC